MEFIDFRSDTVTHPTDEMREAMARAVVGDDGYGEDPTVNQLEAETAELLGKEAALFVNSGTQGNLIAILVHCQRGHEMILGDRSHVFMSEVGGASALAGVHPRTVPVQIDGTLRLEDVRASVRKDLLTYPRTGLLILENTQAASCGAPLTPEYTAEAASIAHEHKIRVHIDGARLFNAAVALGVPASRLVEQADSATFCLSKGLCAPVGSMLVGNREFIHEARRMRKMLGGGLRQAGVLAAAGLIAIRQMTQRLDEDHKNACLLAEGLATVPHISTQVERVKTNFVFFELQSDAPLTALQLKARLKQEYGILVSPYPGSEQFFRVLTHYWITPEHVGKFVDAMREILT